MALIYDGRELECRAHVFDWRAHGLTFTPDSKNCGVRPRPPTIGIVHFTGGENPPPQVYETLVERKLGVEFAMDLYGHIWQFCDPAKVYTAHAHGVNVRGFGIEVQNRGLAKAPNAILAPTWAKWNKEVPRGVDSSSGTAYTLFTLAQLDALIQFFEAFTEAGILKARVPKAWKRFTPAQRAKFCGVAGHFHVDDDKLDPGPQFFEELADDPNWRAV